MDVRVFHKLIAVAAWAVLAFIANAMISPIRNALPAPPLPHRHTVALVRAEGAGGLRDRWRVKLPIRFRILCGFDPPFIQLLDF
jgi:hypothetical protein